MNDSLEHDLPLAEDYANRALRFICEKMDPNGEAAGMIHYILYEIYSERHKMKEAEGALVKFVFLSFSNSLVHSIHSFSYCCFTSFIRTIV
jgi:hypothetical protein